MAGYFESTVKLTKKVKSAMTYPIAVIGLAVALVNVLLIFVIPVFAAMFADFGAKLPAPTQFLIDLSNFMKAWWWAIGLGLYGACLIGNVPIEQTVKPIMGYLGLLFIVLLVIAFVPAISTFIPHAMGY